MGEKSYYIVIYYTGHEAFKERLHRQGLAEDPRCGCPLRGPETPEHILYECTKYNSIRDRLRERALLEGVAWPPQLDFWVRRGCYKAICGQDDAAETRRGVTP